MKFDQRTAEAIQKTFGVSPATVLIWQQKNHIPDHFLSLTPDEWRAMKPKEVTFRIGNSPLSERGRATQQVVLDLLGQKPRPLHAKKLGHLLNYDTKLQVLMTKRVRAGRGNELSEEEADGLRGVLVELGWHIAALLYLSDSGQTHLLTEANTLDLLRRILQTPWLNAYGMCQAMPKSEGERLYAWLMGRRQHGTLPVETVVAAIAPLRKLHADLTPLFASANSTSVASAIRP